MSDRIILAIETSKRASSLCLCLNGTTHTSVLGDGKQQGSDLIPQIKSFLAEHQVAPESVSDLALHVGPGGSTGLRMGIALAQGFSMVYPNIKIHAVPLEAMALELLLKLEVPQNKAMLLADAYGGSVFVQRYNKVDNDFQYDGQIEIQSREDVLAYSEECAIVPDLGHLREKLEWPAQMCFIEDSFPNASLVLAVVQKSDEYVKPIQEIDVRYLKASSAEINWQKRQEGK
ncbi:MAG: tRNA (adenosine(37)-N6)-threonylcarbamoyltransferase complex dimerization subunit type 1 TsaB [Planctomycetes bacterium]|nr:tRNA (adenosine(37)-N6)-threonylcarbamoyltransferase complex dimerization subunit type 1 TsaB [Planctomycetota bacterium]